MAMAAQPIPEIVAQQRRKIGQRTGAGSAQYLQHKDHDRIHKAGQRKNDAKRKIFAQHDAAHRHRACEQQLVGAGAAFLRKGAHGEHRDIQKQHKRGAVKRVIAKIRQAVAQIQRHKIDSRCRQHKGGKHRTDHAVKATAEFSFKDGQHLNSPPPSAGASCSGFFGQRKEYLLKAAVLGGKCQHGAPGLGPCPDTAARRSAASSLSAVKVT